MSSLLDILGGLMVGGMLLLIAMTATDNATQAFVNYRSDAIVQQNLAQISKIMEFDLNKLGFGISEADKNTTLQTTESDELKFLAHLNLNSDSYVDFPGVSTFDTTVDSVEYFISLSDSLVVADTTLYLYEINRTVSLSTGNTFSASLGQIGNNDVFRYLDQSGNPTAIDIATRMVEVTLTAYRPEIMLSPELVNDDSLSQVDLDNQKSELRRLLRASYWRQTKLISKNLQR